MKCLIIDSSPQKNHTNKVVEIVKEKMSYLGQVQFEEVFLYKEDFEPCLGCMTCFLKDENKCPHAKTIQSIAQKIDEADCVIITSPSYSLHVTAVCKNFIDHMSYNFHRPSYFDKKMLAISTQAGGGSKQVNKYLSEVFTYWGFNHCYSLTASSGSWIDNKPDEKTILKSEKIAEKFYNDVASKKLHSPSFKTIATYNTWRALTKKTSSADDEYWIKSGLRETPFSPQVKIGIIKKVIGNLIYKIMNRVFK